MASSSTSPTLIGSEVASGVRRGVAAGQMSAEAGWAVLHTWRRLGMTRYPTFSVLDRIWELRDSLTAHHAADVALAEALDCALLTADDRLGRAPGVRCPVTVVPR